MAIMGFSACACIAKERSRVSHTRTNSRPQQQSSTRGRDRHPRIAGTRPDPDPYMPRLGGDDETNRRLHGAYHAQHRGGVQERRRAVALAQRHIVWPDRSFSDNTSYTVAVNDARGKPVYPGFLCSLQGSMGWHVGCSNDGADDLAWPR